MGNGLPLVAGAVFLLGVSTLWATTALHPSAPVAQAARAANRASSSSRVGNAGTVATATATGTPPPLSATATAVPPAPTDTPIPAPTATAMAQSAQASFPCGSASPIPGDPGGWLLKLCVQAPSPPPQSTLALRLTVCAGDPRAVEMMITPVPLDSNGYWQDFDTRHAGLTIIAPAGCAPPFTIQVDAQGSETVGGGASVSITGGVSVTAG